VLAFGVVFLRPRCAHRARIEDGRKARRLHPYRHGIQAERGPAAAGAVGYRDAVLVAPHPEERGTRVSKDEVIVLHASTNGRFRTWSTASGWSIHSVACIASAMLDFASQYEAFQRRDPSFDGIVFVAVKTTGVYCRPVCPARTPFARNVRFYPSAAAAERGGFRPCLRCRPETAPFCPAWRGTQTTVERALNLIEQGALDHDNVAMLASRLGIGSRHLTRLFADHLDASPLQVALSLRIQRAKRLLDDTHLSINEVARRAGFSHPRRMRAAFLQLYGRPPSTLRQARTSRYQTNEERRHTCEARS
jgi:AraC family transcriptional regulator of adaptative response/methylated-DNA-[protein]-cysteine methyltransferase